MIGCFRIMYVVMLSLLLSLVGCQRMPEDVMAIDQEVDDFCKRIQKGHIGRGPAEAMFKKLSEVPGLKWRSYLYGKLEKAIFSIQFDAKDFRERDWQMVGFDDLADVCFAYVYIRGGTAFDGFNIWLRRIRKLRDEKEVADSLIGTDEGVWSSITSERYAWRVKYALESSCKCFEQAYHRWRESGELSLEEGMKLQNGFRDLMGREIRTEAQIKIDREKKIEEDRKIWKKIHPDGFD